MIDAKKYKENVTSFIKFLKTEFGFELFKETENGNVFYDIEYRDAKRAISISYENIEDYLQVIVFKLNNGILSDYDDKTNTLHLNILNKTIISRIDNKEREENNHFFKHLTPKSEFEKRLLKSAKELRIALKNWQEGLSN